MKNIYLIIAFALLTACHKENERAAIRRIINQTEFNVEIKVYGDEKAESFQYEVSSKDTLAIEGSCFFGASEYCSLDWTTSLAFGEIIFQDSLKLSYEDLPEECDEKSINADPIRECFGYSKKEENGVLIYAYTITPEDVLMAQTFSE